MNSDRRSLKLWVVLFCVLLLGVLIYIKLQSPKPVAHIQQFGAPGSFVGAAAYGSNAVVYSNGQTLMAYNYTTGKAAPIAPTTAMLNNIDTVSVSPNNNYILFHDRDFNTNGILGQQLAQQGKDPGLDYWWLYNVGSQTFSPLPQGVVVAKVDNNFVYILSVVNSTEHITTYTASNLQQSADISILGSSNFYPVQNGFLLQSPDNNLNFTKDGVVSNQLFQSILLAGVTNDGKTAVGVMSVNGSQNLVAINVANDAVTTIATAIVNAPLLLGSGSVLYVNNQNQLTSYNLATHAGSTWVLSGNLAKIQAPNLKLVALVGPQAAIVTDQKSDYYIIGNGLAKPQNLY